jgi:DNA ligase-1
MKPMLAKEGNPSDLTFPVVVQDKLDGVRAMVVDGKLLSRTLKPIPNAEIRAALERHEFEGLDGELIVGTPTAADAYRQTCSFVMSQSKTGGDWTYYVFDKWDESGSFRQRINAADDIVCDSPRGSRLRTVFHHVANDLAALDSIEANAIARGCEGIIVRVSDMPYKFGRSGKKGPLLKIKRFIDFEAEVIGVYEEMHNANEAQTNALGRTERSTAKAGMVGKGTLGGLILRALNGPAEGVEFRCGTGFDAQMRADFWAMYHVDTKTVIGRTVKIKSFPIGVKDKPRFPVYLGFRDDIDFDKEEGV